MGDQLKGVLFDFDDTLIDWSGVERSWRDLEAAGLARVQTWLERRRIGPSLDLESLVDVYMRRTRTAWMEARLSLRAPFMPTILMSTLHELGLDIDIIGASGCRPRLRLERRAGHGCISRCTANVGQTARRRS